MNKKLMVAALAVTLIGGGIAGAALIPSANADAQTAKVTQTTQADNDKEVADDQAGQADNDKEVADDQAGQADNDKEIADDQEGKEDNDKEVSDDQAVTVAPSQAAVTKEQSIALANKQFPNGTVKKVQIESENGKSVYNITITDAKGTEQEVNVDIASGTIIAEND